MKRLIMITSRVPWPLDKGDKLRAYHQLRSLSQRFEVHLYCLNHGAVSPEARAELGRYCASLQFEEIGRVQSGLNLLLALFSRTPLQVGYFFNPAIRARFDAFADRVQADVLFCQLVRTVLLVAGRTEVRVIDYMDTFSKGIERRMRGAAGPLRWVLGLEHRRLLDFERRVFDDVDARTIISQQDRELIPHPRRDLIHVIPNGVDTEYFSAVPGNKDFDILFNGNMGYPPNVEAAEYLCQRVLPLLRQRRPGVRVLISGARPSPRVLALRSDSVEVSGPVEDIRTSYARARILVAPMLSSIGLQNKLLEAMAMGLPCVTSPLANNALKADPGVEILVADTPEQYAVQALRLLEDGALSEALAQRALRFVHSTYSWSPCNARLADVLEHARRGEPLRWPDDLAVARDTQERAALL